MTVTSILKKLKHFKLKEKEDILYGHKYHISNSEAKNEEYGLEM